ncbi:hypothetical protein ACP275_09G061100 [Erythranthe tilingii]
MKGERKRKRVGKVEQSTADNIGQEINIKLGRDVAAVEKVAAAPMDEEVEEFFAILRRMRVAAKYFQNRDDFNTKAGGGSDGLQDLTATVEAAAADGSYCKEAGGGIKRVVEDCGLDLNRVP